MNEHTVSHHFVKAIMSEVLGAEAVGYLQPQIDKALEKLNIASFLNHTTVPLSGGGQVVLIDTGAVLNPEATAMLQAMYSRDPKSVLEHLKEVAEKGPEVFMTQYFIGYGHKSIGDCGTIVICAEGVSMLCCKAIQDNMLYSGQEASTRYIDFSTAVFTDPIGTESSAQFLEDMREFYIDAFPLVCDDLKRRFPYQEEWAPVHYEKAIKARAFDNLRGFLPAGAQSMVAWCSNLRQVIDKLALLRHHVLHEVREVALAIEDVCCKVYPATFQTERDKRDAGARAAADAYNLVMMKQYYYSPREISVVDRYLSGELHVDNNVSDSKLHTLFGTTVPHATALCARPPWTELPKRFGTAGTMDISFLLDFGSFRDLQRHRAVNQRMPLLTCEYGFEEWYLNELPKALLLRAHRLLDYTVANSEAPSVSPEEFQYYVPMGFKVPCNFTGDLPAVLYLTERRARNDVHYTLRVRAHQLADYLTQRYEEFGLVVHTEPMSTELSVKRGQQDIVKKEQ